MVAFYPKDISKLHLPATYRVCSISTKREPIPPCFRKTYLPKMRAPLSTTSEPGVILAYYLT